AQGGALRCRVLSLLDQAAPSNPREGQGRGGSADSVRDAGVASGRLAGARGVGSLWREFHGTPGSPEDSDAGGLAGVSAAEGLSAERPRRAADGESDRLAETAPDTVRGGYRIGDGFWVQGAGFRVRSGSGFERTLNLEP